MTRLAIITLLLSFITCLSHAQYKSVQWVSTTQDSAWQMQNVSTLRAPASADTITIFPARELQAISGFGSCFNELGYTSLSRLSPAGRDSIMKELYAPGVGACFTLSRMPVGANDFSRDWYSYDETGGDFAMKHFSIANDKQTLIPYIRSALQYNPSLRLWASPWSPPQWMKYNGHYAMSKAPSIMQNAANGITDSQVGKEGTDMFIQKPEYFEAYALYFKKFIEAYKQEGITISMVMPQNEFNSAQWYPACTWTPQGLSKFIKVLSPKMDSLGVKVFFGTLERPSPGLFEEVYGSEKKNIDGIGVQWAGKMAVAQIHKEYPSLTIYQSEQECGDGKNSWAYAKYSWDLMKHYLINGASGYMYWNTSLLKGGVSRWGWTQNSLVVVDSATATYSWTYDYYVLKHLSHFIKPGARLIETSSQPVINHRNDVLGWWEGDLSSNAANLLAFKNTDGSVVIVVCNDSSAKKKLNLTIQGTTISPVMKPDSFNTFYIGF